MSRLRNLLLVQLLLIIPASAQESIPPEVTVTAILESTGGNYAVLRSPSSGYVVKQGQKLGDYTVATVEAGQVVLAHEGKAMGVLAASVATTATVGAAVGGALGAGLYHLANFLF
jgi:hypothetical protein